MDPHPSYSQPPSVADRRSRVAPIIDRSPLPMVEVEGREHIVCFVNPPFCALLGKARNELLGRPFEQIVHGGKGCIKLLDRIYETGAGETHVEPDDSAATPAYWLYAMWPALDESQKAERVVIQLTKAVQFRQNMSDLNEALLLGALRQHELREEAENANSRLQAEIAERRRAEEALRSAQAELKANAEQLEQTVEERTAQLHASIGELEAFAYSLAHDLRAPVRAIRGFTQFTLELPRDQLGPSAVELLERVSIAAARMDSLIQDVLALTNVIRRPVTLAVVNVDKLVHALLQERPELSPPRAEITIESPLLPVFGHEAMLSQCLTNLLSNAVKFVEPNTVPQVRVRTEDPVGVAGEGSFVRIWVEDKGIGIPTDAHERIFEIFQRLHSSARFEGSGIGLAIVRKAAERMGGRVGFESAPGEGSRFWLELPKA